MFSCKLTNKKVWTKLDYYFGEKVHIIKASPSINFVRSDINIRTTALTLQNQIALFGLTVDLQGVVNMIGFFSFQEFEICSLYHFKSLEYK